MGEHYRSTSEPNPVAPGGSVALCETIAEVAEQIRSREISCCAVVEACFSQIDLWEPGVSAWVSLDREGALTRARELDAELASGKYRGPLHGIPIGIKDLMDVAGWPTAAGAPWLKNAIAERDATLVSRLRAAGGIILGKTVTTQFACFDPPVTRNPRNLERTPGGSSSGSAAAVAAKMCLGAIGSQTGGSITRPAAFCGVAGCKPTLGIVPLEGVYPLSKSLDHGGPIARSVGDLAILLSILVDAERAARWRHDAKFGVGSDGGVVPFRSVGPPRIGRLRGMFQERAEPTAWKFFEGTLERLAAAGVIIEEVALPQTFSEVLRSHRVVLTRELGEHHRPFFNQHSHEYLSGIKGLIEEGLRVSNSEYAAAKAHQQALLPAVVAAMNEVDFLACPAAIGSAPPPDTTGDPCFNAPWSYTGQPTISFPMGMAPDGLPLAIQLVGRPHEEPRLFGSALWCEQQLA